MQNARYLIFMMLALFVVILGCDDDDGSEQSNGVSADALTTSICERQAECCPGNESVAECKSSLSLAVDPLFAIDGIEIDEAAYQSCLDKFAAASCDEVSQYGGIIPVLAVCDFTKPTKATGEACGQGGLMEAIYGDDECLTDYCNEGVCAEKAALGAACASDGCAEGTCYMGTCEAVKALGEDCSEKGLCEEGLDCVWNDDNTAMTCIEPQVIQPGEECGPGKVCSLGESQCSCPVGEEGCVYGNCGDASRCLP